MAMAPSQTLRKSGSGWRRLVRERCVVDLDGGWAGWYLVVVRYLQWALLSLCGEKKQVTFLCIPRVQAITPLGTTRWQRHFTDITKQLDSAKSGKGSEYDRGFNGDGT